MCPHEVESEDPFGSGASGSKGDLQIDAGTWAGAMVCDSQELVSVALMFEVAMRILLAVGRTDVARLRVGDTPLVRL